MLLPKLNCPWHDGKLQQDDNVTQLFCLQTAQEDLSRTMTPEFKVLRDEQKRRIPTSRYLSQYLSNPKETMEKYKEFIVNRELPELIEKEIDQLNIPLTLQEANMLRRKIMERYSRDHQDRLLDTQKNKMMCNRLRKNATEELPKQPEDLVETIKSNQELRQISKPDPQTETEHDPRLQAIIGRYEASIDPTKPITGFQCRINTYEDKFVQCKPYVQPKYMNEQVDEIIKELEELDIIEESTSAWASPYRSIRLPQRTILYFQRLTTLSRILVLLSQNTLRP